jgi:cell wall-associated NlpC family hydrolase
MEVTQLCPICHSSVSEHAKKCRHCHNYLGISLQYLWEESVRVLGLVAVIAAAVVAWKSLEFTLIAEREKKEAQVQVAISQRERDALKEDFSTGIQAQGPHQQEFTSAPEKSLIQAAEKSNDVRVRQLLASALKLKQDGVPFRMGGKSPDDGFDSSGFVTYLLAEAGAMDPQYHRTFSVSKLEKTFPKVRPEDAKPGDLIFIGTSFVAVNLGGNEAVGIGSSKGISVFSFSAKSKKSFHRWAYGQDARLVR